MAVEGFNVTRYLGRDGSVTAAVNLRAAHTIAFRVRHTSTTTTGDTIMGGYTTLTSGNSSGSYISRPAGVSGLRMFRYDGLFTYNQFDTSPAAYGDTTTWYHVAFVYDTSGTPAIRGYINGSAAGSVNSATTLPTSTTSVQLAFAAHQGVFSDVVFFGRALTAGEVQELANIRRPRNMSSCIAWYPEVNSATLTPDYSGNGNTLSSLGSGTANAFSADSPPTAWRRSPTNIRRPAPAAFDLGACTGSASTTGTAAVSCIKALGACTGATSTTGAAAVGMSNVVAAASAATTAIADIFRPGGQGWRSPLTAGCNGSASAVPFTGAGSFSVCAWIRTYRQTSGITQFGAVIENGADPQTVVLIRASSSAGTASAGCRITEGGATVVDQSATYTLGEWAHVGITYDGTDLRLYLNGSQFYTTAYTLPVGATSRVMYATMFAFSGANYNDFAQFRAWRSVALGAGEVAAERDAARPVSQLSGLTWVHLLAWDNPGWNANLGGALFPVDGNGGDSDNGPPSTWPAVSATGATSTNGAASVSLVYALGACTGATSTAGTAAVSGVVGIAATGSTSTVGASSVVVGTNAAGATSTSGSATLEASAALVAAGSAQTDGAATVNLLVVATGATSTTGAAASAWNFATTGAGETSTAGVASVTAQAGIAAAGSATTGVSSAAASSSTPLAATGSTSTGTSSASSTVSAGLASSGQGSAAGAAAVGSGATLAVAGQTSSSGSATVGASAGLVVTGEASTLGIGAIAAAAGLAAAGATSTTGAASPAGTLASTGATTTVGATSFDTALFPVVAAGGSSTSGQASVAAGILFLAASGATSTDGASTVGASALLAAAGETATGGAASFSSSAALAAAGESATVGDAANGSQYPVVADGNSSTGGSATVAASAGLVAAGASSTSGTGLFTSRADGSAQTTGAVVIQLFANLPATGNSSTSGAAALGNGIFPSGQSSTNGIAAVASSAQLVAVGQTLTFGNAAFDGVAPGPGGGGGGGDEKYSRRQSAIGAGRRALR